MRQLAFCILILPLTLGATCGGDDPGDTPPTPDAGTPDPGDPPEPSPDAGSDPAPDAGSGGGVVGCDGVPLLANPDDPAARGPWTVGARTMTIGRLKTEVWYPVAPGAEQGSSTIRYDIREALPASERSKIPDDKNTWQDCDCYRDLPIDAAHGPYPVIVFVHGTGAFRHQSLTQMEHWASRGFVVVAADHPGLFLGDLLALPCLQWPSGPQDLTGDVDVLLAAVRGNSDELAFLAGRVDTQHIALVGHSAGGSAVAKLANRDGVRVVIPMAGAEVVAAGGEPVSTLTFAGTTDSVVPADRTIGAYERSPAPKRFVLIEDAGHLAFSDLCEVTNVDGKNLIETATEYGICGVQFAGGLFDCNPSFIDGPDGWDIIHAASSAVLESVLQCDPSAIDSLSTLESTYPAVVEFRQDL